MFYTKKRRERIQEILKSRDEEIRELEYKLNALISHLNVKVYKTYSYWKAEDADAKQS